MSCISSDMIGRSIVSIILVIPNPKFLSPVITFVRIPDALNNAITTAHQHDAHAEALVLPPEP